MNQLFLTILALIPFTLLFILIVLKKWPAIKAMPLVWFLTVLISVLIWKINSTLITASFIKGIFITLEIMLIIFGAIWLLELLKKKRQIKEIQFLLSSISPDARIQALIIAWLFGSLIEGIAGFGTSAALAAPLLVSLGFTPFLAVVVSLIANSTAVSFGAAGTPIILGMGGLNLEREFLEKLTQQVALFHFIASIIIPLIIVYLVIKSTNKQTNKQQFIEIIPFAIFAWLSFSIPYLLVAWFIGPELPSIVGGIAGLILTSIAAKKKFLTPKNQLILKKNKQKQKKHNYIKTLLPYLAIVILLSLSRTIPSLKSSLSEISITWNNILQTSINYSFLPIFTPSFYFFTVGIISIFLFKINKKEISSTLKNTYNKIKLPTIALIFALALAQLLLISSQNNSGFPGIPLLLAQSITKLFQQSFILISPFIGVFGSFIAGSNTVSNLLFGSFQIESAQTLGISLITILTLQVVGGAIGNMIAIHNVLAASATVNLKNQEGKIIRKTIKVAILYSIIVGVLGIIALSIT